MAARRTWKAITDLEALADPAVSVAEAGFRGGGSAVVAAVSMVVAEEAGGRR